MMRLVIAVLACFALALPAQAQTPLATTNFSTKIVAGGTFQQALSVRISGQTDTRRAITIMNNNAVNTSDNCYLIFGTNIATQINAGTSTLSSTITVNGVSMTLQQASIRLSNGGSYQRYYPYVPSDAFFVTCDTTGDTLYIDAD